MLKFECQRCGKCCQGDTWLRNLIKPGDVEKWKEMKRDDILKYVCACCNRLVDPDNHNAPWRKENCPFLEFHNGKAGCKIYDVRPHTCKGFPINECENPQCSEKFHFHTWLWNGNCQAAKKFRTDIVSIVEDEIGT